MRLRSPRKSHPADSSFGRLKDEASPQSSGWAWLAAAITLLVISWPLRFDLDAARQAYSRLALISFRPEWGTLVRDGVANVLVFVPFGVVARATAGTRIARIGIIALGLGILLEAAQVFQPGRIVSSLDVIANGAGGVLGAWLVESARRVLRRVDRTPMRAEFLTIVLTVLAIGVAVWSQARFADLSPWSKSTLLQIGDEATGSRPWCGEVTALLFESGGRSWSEGDLMLVARESGAPAGRFCGQAGWRQSVAAPLDLIESVERSGRLRLSFVAATTHSAQSGPARIVSLSRDNDHRNVTVAQEGADLVLRVRRRWGGDNGVRPYFVLPGVFATAAPVSIRIELSSDSTIVQAGERELRHHHDVTGQWWMLLAPSVRGRPSVVDFLARVAFWGALLGPLGALIGALLRHRRLSTARAAALLGASTTAVYVGTALPHQSGSWQAGVAMLAAVAGGVSLGLLVSHRHHRSGVGTTRNPELDMGEPAGKPLLHGNLP